MFICTNEYYLADKKRMGGNAKGYTAKLLKLYRFVQSSGNTLSAKIAKRRYLSMSRRNGIEIPISCKIGKGLYIGHPYCITINPNVVIGENCNIHKGVTIGQENRGARKGVPTIGNVVWIGVNATIVGRITIGDDVLIAPGSYVNCDVPSHSVVFGNPCTVHCREHATEGYINNIA